MHPPLAFVGVDDGAELGLVVVAMFAILILAGLYLISQIFSAAFSKIPVIGPPIGRAFDWVTRWARGATIKTIHGVLWACGKLAHALMALLNNMYQIQLDAIRAVIDAAEHTRFVTLPREITAARQFALQQANQVYYQARAYTNQQDAEQNKALAALRTWAKAQLLDLQNTLVRLINATRSVLDARITDAVNQLTAKIQALGKKEAADFAKAESDIQAAEARLNATIGADVKILERTMSADVASLTELAKQLAADAERQAVADVNAAVHVAMEASWPPVTAMIGQLQEVAAPDFQAVLALLALVPDAIPQTAPEAFAATETVLPPIVRLLTDCVIPQCRDLGGLRNFLHNLLSAGFDAALIAWLIYCIEDPQGAARDTEAIGGPIANDTVGALLGLFGVHP